LKGNNEVEDGQIDTYKRGENLTTKKRCVMKNYWLSQEEDI
jgi:hypothetical protein